jgi:CheY-like chemotaxis protein
VNSRSTILLIMSDPARERTMSAYLQLVGADVQSASSALQALTQLERLLPDAIVCDAQLEDMSGLELLEIVRSERCYDDVVFLLLGAPEDDEFGLRDLALPHHPTGPEVRRNGRLRVSLLSSDVDLFVANGQVMHARYGLETGDGAAQAIVTGTRVLLNAEYTFTSTDLSGVPRTVSAGVVRT